MIKGNILFFLLIAVVGIVDRWCGVFNLLLFHPCLTPCSHTDRPTDTPLFIMEEQSSCYMRGCCGPAQPALVKFHNVSFGGERQEKKCCCIVLQPKRKMYNKAGAAVMTMEKAGMCGNCAQFGPTNCWVCFSMCQSEAWMHSGDIPSTYSPQGCACFKSKTNQITKSHCVCLFILTHFPQLLF
jgi:hypothetical protein